VINSKLHCHFDATAGSLQQLSRDRWCSLVSRLDRSCCSSLPRPPRRALILTCSVRQRWAEVRCSSFVVDVVDDWTAGLGLSRGTESTTRQLGLRFTGVYDASHDPSSTFMAGVSGRRHTTYMQCWVWTHFSRQLFCISLRQ